MSATHWSLGHVGVGGSGSGSSVVIVTVADPFRGVGCGPVLPATVTAVSCPGATLPPGLVHSTDAIPGAEIVTSNVVPPRPATLAVHSTCVPMSVQSGALPPCSMKCPLCAY